MYTPRGPICRRFSCTLLIPRRVEVQRKRKKEERCTEEGGRERESRVSGSVGRVTERFRVPLAPALTRLPDTVTSVDPRVYPPRAVSPFSLKHAARSAGRETVCAANSSNRGKIAIPKPRTGEEDARWIYARVHRVHCFFLRYVVYIPCTRTDFLSREPASSVYISA